METQAETGESGEFKRCSMFLSTWILLYDPPDHIHCVLLSDPAHVRPLVELDVVEAVAAVERVLALGQAGHHGMRRPDVDRNLN